MKKYIFFWLIVCGWTFVFAQEDPSVKYANTITPEELRGHLSVIASDFYAGRETATKGQRMAADYIAKQFQLSGIPPVGKLGGYFQEYPLISIAWDSSFISDKKNRYVMMRDFYGYATANNSLEANADEIIFLGYGIDDSVYSDYRDINVKGKVILVASGEPVRDGVSLITKTESMSDWSKDWRKKAEAATAHGALCMLVIEPRMQDILSNRQWWKFLNGSLLKIASEYEPSEYCTNLFVSQQMAEGLLGKKKNMMQRSIEQINKTFIPYRFTIKASIAFGIHKEAIPIDAQNVLGYVEGTDLKDQLVIVSAHYDHLGKNDTAVFNGADDDGSGTVGLIEIAEAMMEAKKNNEGPRRSVLILAFSGEEKGLLGSKSYVADPVFPLGNTVADLNIDMIGRVDDAHVKDSSYVYIIGSDFLSTELHRINEAAAKTYTDLQLDYKFNSVNDPNRFYYRSDHYNFAKNNIPVIFYFNGTHADYHKTTDDIDKISFDLLAERTRLVFHTLWMLSNQDIRIKVDVSQ